MAVEPDFLDHLLDLFAALGPIRVGRMFSGAGLFVEEDVMFALLGPDGQVYLKSDDSTAPTFRAAGSGPFRYPFKSSTRAIHSFMTLPESALDDPEEALHWARLALPPARAAALEKRRTRARKAARKKAGPAA